MYRQNLLDNIMCIKFESLFMRWVVPNVFLVILLSNINIKFSLFKKKSCENLLFCSHFVITNNFVITLKNLHKIGIIFSLIIWKIHGWNHLNPEFSL